MIIGNTTYNIGKLERTIIVDVYDWGVNLVACNKSPNLPKTIFVSRSFRKTKKYPTIEANIKRGLKYFKAPTVKAFSMCVRYHQVKDIPNFNLYDVSMQYYR